MLVPRRRLACAWLVVVGACAFDSSGPGGSPVSAAADDMTSDPSDSSDPADSEGTGASTSSADASETDVDPDTSGATTDSVDPGSRVVIVGGPLFDFSSVEIGEPATRMIELRNTGAQSATGLGAALDGEWFDFAGGEYPGTNGTCGEMLGADERCVVVVACNPTHWGGGEGELTVSHVDPVDGAISIAADLVGNGTGETKNLVRNGDGEQQGSPPPQWQQLRGGGTDWHTTTSSPASGAGSIAAGWGAAIDVLEVRQEIDVEDWATYVDAGDVTIALSAAMRTDFDDDDPVKVRVILRSDDDEVGRFETDWYGATSWTTRSAELVAPPGTRTIVVVLRCDREVGETCNGYFDDVRVTGRI